jgi:hypothetical protein
VNNPPPITVTFPENFQVQNNPVPIVSSQFQTLNVNVPKEFDESKPAEYRQFLRACEHTFEVQASRYPTEGSELSLLSLTLPMDLSDTFKPSSNKPTVGFSRLELLVALLWVRVEAGLRLGKAIRLVLRLN